MTHYLSQDWADFVNRVVSTEKRADMQLHIENGCRECAGALKLWKTIGEMVRREAFYQPPDETVEHLKASFVPQALSTVAERISEAAQLVFDSFREPLPAGVRSAGPTARQLLYKAGDILIDMRMEPQAESERVSVVGQVLDSAQSGKGVHEIPVSLLSGRDKLAQTMTNRFGEFHLEYAAAKSVQLSVGVSNRKNVFIPLDESIWRIPFGR